MAICLPPHGVVAVCLVAELPVHQLDIPGGRRRLAPTLIVLDAAELRHHPLNHSASLEERPPPGQRRRRRRAPARPSAPYFRTDGVPLPSELGGGRREEEEDVSGRCAEPRKRGAAGHVSR